jgi:hypothetical protein
VSQIPNEVSTFRTLATDAGSCAHVRTVWDEYRIPVLVVSAAWLPLRSEVCR